MSKHHNLKIILAIVIAIIVFIALFIIGVVVGFSTIGKGDWHLVFQWDTWQHIFDFWN